MGNSFLLHIEVCWTKFEFSYIFKCDKIVNHPGYKVSLLLCLKAYLGFHSLATDNNWFQASEIGGLASFSYKKRLVQDKSSLLLKIILYNTRKLQLFTINITI